MKHTLKMATTAAVMGLTAVVTAPEAQAQTEEVNVLLFGMPYTRGLQAIAGDFEAQTGIKANIDVVGQDVFENRITLNFTGGARDIDVVHFPLIQVQRWVQADWMAPLTSEIRAFQDVDDIFPGTLNSFEVNGELWGVPFFAEVGMMAYRSDIIDSPPDTWVELDEVLDEVGGDIAGLAMRAGPAHSASMFVFPMLMHAYGGNFFADFPTDMTPIFDSPENLAALELYVKLMNEHGPEGISGFAHPQVIAAAQSGEVAVMVDASALAAQATNPEASRFAEEFDIALVPAGPEKRSPALAVHGLGVPAVARDVEASAMFIEWATSVETMTKIALNESYPDFVRASVAQNEEVRARYASIQDDYLDLRNEALALSDPLYRPLIPEWAEIGAALGEHVNAAVSGIVSPAEALAAGQADMEDIMGN